MNAAYKNIMKAMALFGGVQGLNIGLNLVRTKLVALFLGPAGVGLSSIYNETKELIHESTNMGMDQSGVREISVAYERWKENGEREPLDNAIMLVRSWVALFAIAGIFACILFAYPLSVSTFGDTEHIIGYMLLAPAVGMATITCGEMAILKATRQLKSIASLSTINIITSIFTNVPLYYLYGMKGVIPAILLFSLCQMLIVLHFSYRNAPFRVKFEKLFLIIGKPMLMLGGAFVLQGFMEHGTKLAIQAFINSRGNLTDVGLYNSATMIITTYLGIFASSIAVDFYPRLSGIFADKEKRALTVHRQIDVLQLFTAPMLVAFLIGIHIIVPVLLSYEFIRVVPVLEIALISCLTRSLSQPMAFMPLAAGDSKFFLFVDIIDFILMFAVYTTCYAEWGLTGIAYGICTYNLLDLIWVAVCMNIRYGILPNMRNILFFIIQTIILFCAFLTIKNTNGITYWTGGCMLTAISVCISYFLFRTIKHEE